MLESFKIVGSQTSDRSGLTKNRHRASTSTRWHIAFGLCCHSNETRSPIPNPSNSAQLEGTPTILPSYIQVRAVVSLWACGEGHTHTHRHTDARDQYTFRLAAIRLTRNVIKTRKIYWARCSVFTRWTLARRTMNSYFAVLRRRGRGNALSFFTDVAVTVRHLA